MTNHILHYDRVIAIFVMLLANIKSDRVQLGPVGFTWVQLG